MLCCLLFALAFGLSPVDAPAHPPSSFGGLFRTRDSGTTWFVAHPSKVLASAIALAISPVDPNSLLLATDDGLLWSGNGGRDWRREAADVVLGPAFAVAFDADGRRALVSTASAIVRSDEGGWRSTPVPAGTVPARALVRGSVAGRVYLAGWRGLYRSDDWGTSWFSVADGLPEGPVTGLVVAPGSSEVLYALVEGRLWASLDAARHWALRTISSGSVEALTVDPTDPARLWIAAACQVYRGEDRGARWQAVGQPLPELDTVVRGIAVSPSAILLATDRGLFRSPDRGERWDLLTGNLPSHLEAGVLVRDAVSPSVLYAGFAPMPYDEIWRRAAEGRSALQRLNVTTLASAAVLLVLLAIGGIVVSRQLAARYYPSPPRVSPFRGTAQAPQPQEELR